MLLDDEPAAIIQSCTENFKIDSDKASIARINASLDALYEAHDFRIKNLTAKLTKLSYTLDILNSQLVSSRDSQNDASPAREMLQLDSTKFRLAKQNNDLTAECEALESQLASLNHELKSLNSLGYQGSQPNHPDHHELEILLMLKLYRSLGLEIESDHTGKFCRVIIRNIRKGDVRIIKIDPNTPPSNYTNEFWQYI